MFLGKDRVRYLQKIVYSITFLTMKKYFLLAVFAIMMASCAEKSDTIFEEPEMYSIETRTYTLEEVKYIDEVYNFCIKFNDMFNIPEYLIFDDPTIKQKLELIKYCDLQDRGGDIFMGWDSYDLIFSILWPNGYGVD